MTGAQPAAAGRDAALLGLALAALAAGAAARLLAPAWAGPLWTLGTLPVLAALLLAILRGLARGAAGLDILAALSMSAALAFGETLAAQIVAVMYAGGTFLERFAEGRARREMTALLARVPRSALRHGPAGLEEIPVAAIRPGDRLLVRKGDVLPADGIVAPDAAAPALVDLAALTGESLPVRAAPGAELPGGGTNAGEAFDLLAMRRAEESSHAAIVRLVAAAAAERAPAARLADRHALGFLAFALGLALVAGAASGDPVRAVAVLVVATPCPLILAVPVALVAGLSRAAAQGILVKGGRALEALARARVLVLDKTGTLTEGAPRLLAVRPEPGSDLAPDEILRLAAALDRASAHPVARAIVAGAEGCGLALPVPAALRETPGEGIEGEVEGRQVLVGGPGFAERRTGWDGTAARAIRAPGESLVAVAVDGRVHGLLVVADRLRDGAGGLVAALRAEGFRRVVLATGDRPDVAAAVAAPLGLDHVAAGLDPAGKVALVRAERAAGPVLMVGDGVNDAPALAAADAGIAMGARGAAAAAEAADVVILVDRLDRLLPARRIARRSLAIARQSVLAGIGLSTAGMVAAALGHLPPVAGALLQEAIDVAVILNALRALGGGDGTRS